MSQPLSEWKPIDATNAIVVPLFLMLTIGVLLAIYTGIIATRVFAFFQIRAKAVSWVFNLREVMVEDHASPHDFSMKLGQATQGIILEFRSLGHENAAALLGDIFKAYLLKTAEVCGIPVPPHGIPAFPDTVRPEVWQQRFWAIRDLYSKRLNDDAAAISGVRPSISAILSPLWFPDYISDNGKYRGMLVPRRDKKRQ